jgi:N-acetylglutamate synthase-like GNAT family acetyltransferase
LKIRKASTDDVDRLTEIAHHAKRYWGYPDHWIEHWKDQLTITADFVSANQVFLAEDEGKVLGFYALVINSDKAELDHLWVDPKHIGTGVGKDLFLHAMQSASKQNVGTVEICADPNAEGFYRKMGAFRTGETISEIDGESRTLPQLNVDPAKVTGK